MMLIRTTHARGQEVMNRECRMKVAGWSVLTEIIALHTKTLEVCDIKDAVEGITINKP